jgi:hypothetical protein
MASCFLLWFSLASRTAVFVAVGWALLVGVPVAHAQDAFEAATLRGTVRSADDGGSLLGANVVLETDDGGIAYAAAVGSGGTYIVQGIAPGRYPLRVSYVGYRTVRDTLTLAPGESRVYDVQMEVLDRELGEVTVEAERSTATREAGLQTIRAADLDRIPTPGATGDLAAYLVSLPGVVAGGDRGGQLYIRGGTPSQNLVLVDGLPITKPFHLSSLFSAFPQDIVSSVDLYSGGHDARYMGAISSVMDVSLRAGNFKRAAGSASVGPFMVAGQAEGPIVRNRSSFLVSVRQSVIEDVADPVLGREVPMNFRDLSARLTLRNDVAECSLTGMHTYDRGRVDTERDLVLAWSNTLAGGRCFVFDDDLDGTTTLVAGYSHFDNESGTRAAPERSAGLSRLHGMLDRERTTRWGRFGFGTRAELVNYTYALDEKFVALDVKDQGVFSLQTYASLTWEPSSWLSVNPSVGSHFAGSTSNATFEPRLRLSVRPGGTDRREVAAAVGIYNQIAEGITDERDAGTVFTIWTPALRDDPLPEAWHAILSYRERLAQGIEASIEGYARRMQNLPVPLWTPVARFNTRTTLADGDVVGADVRLAYDRGPAYLFLGYGWSRVTYEATTSSLGAWVGGEVFDYNPPHDLRHQLSMVASYDLGLFTTNVRWAYGSGRPFTQVFGYDLALDLGNFEDVPTRDPGRALTIFDRPYGARLPAYHRLDVSVERDFDLSSRLALETQVGVLNGYDRANILYFDLNTLRRTDQEPLLPYASLRLVLD